MISLGVVARADHAAATVQHAEDPGPLVHLVDRGYVVACECDLVRHGLFLLLLVAVGESGDLAPALEGLAVVAGRARVGQSRRAGAASVAALGGVLAVGLEQPRLCGLQLFHVVVVVAEKGAGRLHVARARELEPEADAVALGLGLDLGRLAAQFFCRLRGLCDLRLKGGDLLVALGDGLLVVGARAAAGAAGHFLGARRAFLLLLLRLGFRALRGCLSAILLTVHSPACLS